MFGLDRDSDTICALATPKGVSALAIVRMSGDKAEATMRKVAALPSQLESHHIYYAFIRSPDTGELVDEVMISFFASGHSYTREPSFEISCHGSATIVEKILRALLLSGARMAERGEFTYRAFMSGRIDLVQAEGVLDLIESQSGRSAKMAIKSLRGELSNLFLQFEDEIETVLAQIEANIDFSSEDIVFAKSEDLLAQLETTESEMTRFLESYKSGRIIKEGLTVAIVGAPNVGKSSLFNKLVGEDRSIVSEHAGTTRDWVDFEIQRNGQRIRFIDSAGIRSTSEEVEALGVARALEIAKSADLILKVIDIRSDNAEIKPLDLSFESADQTRLKNCTILTVGNKIDLLGENEAPKVKVDALVSAHTGQGIKELVEKILKLTSDLETYDDSPIIQNVRQFETLKLALSFLAAAKGLMLKNLSAEFVAVELQSCLTELMKIRGVGINKELSDKVMDRVFSEFCIGK